MRRLHWNDIQQNVQTLRDIRFCKQHGIDTTDHSLYVRFSCTLLPQSDNGTFTAYNHIYTSRTTQFGIILTINCQCESAPHTIQEHQDNTRLLVNLSSEFFAIIHGSQWEDVLYISFALSTLNSEYTTNIKITQDTYLVKLVTGCF